MFCILFAAAFCETLVEKINNDPRATWTAKQYPPSKLTVAKLRARCGLRHSGHKISDLTPSNAVPDTFDCREQWSGICTVRDQGNCGSCWAFSTTSMFTDRKTIAGSGVGMLSAQDLISCDTLDYACDGGNFYTAFTWFKNAGVTTEECLPYVSYYERVPSCPTTCNDGTTITRYKCSSHTMFASCAAAQEDMYANGPINAGFDVYYDFYMYESGVYVHLYGEYLGSHAIVICGWGTSSNIPYWLCQNSWGADWAEAGFFRILRGSNHCLIEDELCCCYA